MGKTNKVVHRKVLKICPFGVLNLGARFKKKKDGRNHLFFQIYDLKKKRARAGPNLYLVTETSFRQDRTTTPFDDQWAKPISRTKVRSLSRTRTEGVQEVRRESG